MKRIVKMKFKEDQVNVFLDLFEKKRDAIAAFQGCRHLDLLRDKEASGSRCIQTLHLIQGTMGSDQDFICCTR
jgi:quinol monooxygenase YgiN